ncbi:MAG: diguanylate cyclase [Gammaproteobacteria bacterium]|nr:diguanylate cyclase [Gammaproteobacteria bacterium]
MNEQFADKLNELRLAYLQRLPQQVNAVIEDYNLLGVHWDPRLVTALLLKLHTLKGSSGTFGFKSFCNAVSEFEVKLKAYQNTDAQLGPSENPMAQFRPLLQALLHAMQQAQQDWASQQANAISHTPAIEHSPVPTSVEQKSHPVNAHNPAKKSAHNPVLFLVDNDVTQGEILRANLTAFGFFVHYFSDLASLAEGLEFQQPDICLIDLHLPNCSEDEIFSRVVAFTQHQIPVIVLSASGQFQQRIKAVRAKAQAYFTKPVKMNELVAKLRHLLDFEPRKPFKVLMIDDQESILNYHQHLFSAHGIECRTTQHPELMLEVLRDFEPDLFILDYHLPHFNGAELASMLRQIPAYEATPIVFLTGETADSLKSDLVEIGSDDVIGKDLGADKFVSQITSRIKRGKKLRMLMQQDSLTQLLNHGYIQSLARQMFSHAKRVKTPCSFVMIDLDNFKMVNDRFGHSCGDRVIVALTQMLQQRLRQSDGIGRYGGEEFLVLMPDTDLNTAHSLISKLLHQFSQLKFFERNIEFHASFSAGISCATDWNSVQVCLERADQALYQAKKAGRNRVEIATLPVVDSFTS